MDRISARVRAFLLIALIGAVSAAAQSIWYHQYPPPLYFYRHFALHFADANAGWAVGESGSIIRTSDGGATWIPQTSGIVTDLYAVRFIDSLRGWAAGAKGRILHTRDGGAHWLPQPSGTAQNLRALQFLGPDTGWAAGDSGVVLHTVDGGASWSPGFDVEQYGKAQFNSLSFVDGSSGWVAGPGGILMHTDDGGKTWNPQGDGATPYVLVRFLDAQRGWVGGGATLARTLDGGRTWTALAPPEPGFASFGFTTADSGWGLSENGIFAHTGDGGKTWAQDAGRDGLSAAFFLDPSTGWAFAAGGVTRTRDGGKTWSAVEGPFEKPVLYAVSFADSLTGCAVGSPSTILRTGDGGRNWTRQATGISYGLFGVRMADPHSGWAVGAGGTILHTRDGGISWSPQKSGTSALLRAISFLGADTGWIAGDSGVVIRTFDGGAHWDALPRAPGYVVTLQFLDAGKGYAISGGLLCRTVDGGMTWIKPETGSCRGTSDMHFPDTDTGWASCNADLEGRFLKTVDGGKNWSDPAETPVQLYFGPTAVVFMDTRRGLAAATDGVLYQTENGGKNWSEQRVPGARTLMDIAYAQGHAWAVGIGGQIVSTDLGRRLGTPALAFPADGAMLASVPVDLIWMGVDGITRYRVQVAKDSAFRDLLLDDTLLNAPLRSWSPPAPSIRYFWRVANQGPDGKYTAWSPIWSFTSPPELGIAPVRTEPGGLILTPDGFLRFDLTARMRVRIILYDLKGKRTAMPFDGEMGPGGHAFRPAPAWTGIRILDFEAGSFRSRRLWLRR